VTQNAEKLVEMIHACDQQWLIEYFEPPDEAAAHLCDLIQRAETERNRRHVGGLPLTIDTLNDLFARQQHRVTAFLQALGGTRTPTMLVMVWRVLQGMEIDQLVMEYNRAEKRFFLRIELVSPYGEPTEAYESDEINDAALVRHFGIMKMDGRPIMDGFYALRMGEAVSS